VNSDDLAHAIRIRDAAAIRQLLFEGDPPRVRSGARTETELWDFKEEIPSDVKGWIRTARHVVALHNNRGGVLAFGIRDGDLAFVGARRRIDSKVFNEKLRRYVGDQIWIDFHREAIADNQRYLGIAIIPPRGPTLASFQHDAPLIDGTREFLRGQSARRLGDSSIIMERDEAAQYQASLAPPVIGSPYAVNEPFFRILSLETPHFIPRNELTSRMLDALRDPRTSVTSLIGVGGTGKTTLATWAALQAFDSGMFGFIVSTTAKDRELTSEGIQSLGRSLTSYETLLESIADVLGFPEFKSADLIDREAGIRELLQDSNGLLYIDNLETVDDPRVVTFLDDLPVGVRALVTSRRATVRVSVRPIDVGPLSEQEARSMVRSLQPEPGLGYVASLTDAEIARIAKACDHLPLALRWTLTRAQSASEAVHRADALHDSRGSADAELLEFAFRRVFEEMTGTERAVMRTLSIFQDPSAYEALVAGSGDNAHSVSDALEALVRDALVQRRFDSDRNDYVFALAPLTRTFVLGELRREAGTEQRIRRRLSDWYEARDIANSDDRTVVREIRQGRASAELGLLDLAISAERRDDYRSAQDMYEQAISRNPTSWKAARRYAEFERHVNRNTTNALALYERAAANAPRRGQDRALIFREWGMLLRDSGRPDATDAAIEKFEVALIETPNDSMLVHALATMYDRKGVYRRVIELLEPLKTHASRKTREMSLQFLVKVTGPRFSVRLL
jgi:tetratricopeptide (TPR) repeat protein